MKKSKNEPHRKAMVRAARKRPWHGLEQDGGAQHPGDSRWSGLSTAGSGGIVGEHVAGEVRAQPRRPYVLSSCPHPVRGPGPAWRSGWFHSWAGKGHGAEEHLVPEARNYRKSMGMC